MKRVKDRERSLDQIVPFAPNFPVRVLYPDETDFQEECYCIEDLIRALVRRSRNQFRAQELAIGNSACCFTVGDAYTEHYVQYSDLPEVVGDFRDSNFMGPREYASFKNWYDNELREQDNSSYALPDRKDWDEFITNRKEEEEEDNYSVSMIPSQELELLCTVLKSVSKAYQVLPPNHHLLPHLEQQIVNLQRQIEANTPQPPLFREDTTPIVRVTQRIKELRPDVSIETIRASRKDIGELASDLHLQIYGVRPPQFMGWVNQERKSINRYTERTAENTLDIIILEYEF